MSIRNFKFKFVDKKNHIVSFSCEDIVAKVLVLEEDILRVIIHKEDGLKLDKTWLVAPGMEDIPFEGRDRFDTTGFSLPEFKVKEKDDKSIYQQNGRDGYGTLSIQSEDGDIVLHA